ncbi:hybrid sensor histidine kinase/response regulator transcription factor [Ignavibacterium sp.]|uniref:hybrid sensor histidine kinase/response regulator transcription factor n=1 Tax=Ignavibacterium sp. TaxID=2651167 RepID=UPI00220E6080|nr:hybrid sensor histidine kinase/response regulator transcription factor [Ignavibacterium sp.]BDQ03414.1 MAG: hybrid sensor histidine kinase/response regulator [Ignavibacterium sp.]
MNAKKVFKNILFFLLVNLTVFVSEYFPQQIHFDRISTNNGLSNNLIYDILQDKSGFLWIATDDGLNRYDGYEFKIFRNDPNDISSLSDNSVWSLAVDKSGKIWVGTKTGWINCYDPVTEKFSRWYIASNITKDNSITTIFTEDENKIWIGTYRSGLYLLNPKTGEIKNWTLNPLDSTSLTNNYISSIVSDKAGNLWIGTYNGLNKFNYKLSQNKFQRFFKSNNDLNSLSDNLIWSLTIDKVDSSIMWIGTATDLTEFNLSTGKFRRHKISNPLNLQFGSGSGNVIPEIDKNQKLLWIDSYAGLLRYNLFTGNVDRFVYEKNNPNSLPSNRINKIYKDKSGVIWIGTDNGLAKFSTKNKKFNYSISEEINFLNSDELYDISINALTQTTDGTIWFGTEKGLFFSSRDNRKQTIKKYNLLGDINVWSLSADGNNNLWIGTYGKGIFQLDNNNRKLTEWNFVDNKTRSMSRFFNKSILIDDNNNIWIGYWGLGLAKLNPTTKEFTRWIHNNEDSASLSYDDVWVIYQDSRKRIWIGTNGGGLNIYDKLSNFFIHFTTEENSQIKLSSNSIYSICESKYGGQNGKTILWVGTNNGLNKITILNDKNNSLKNVTIKIYSISDGLPDNSIKSLVEDKSGNIWIGTSSGISLFNPLTERFTNFTTADGLVSNDMNLSSAVLLENGLILMGSKSGLNYFKPEEIKLSDFIPPIVLTDLKIFNKSVIVGEKSLLKKSITFSDEINIPYSDNVFSIHFAALDFTSAGEIVYSYKLEGFDKDWNIETKNRFATYTNLNPGKYIFKLRATNSDGVWSDNIKTLTIIITPPWWQTYWAIGLYIIIFVLGVWGIIRFQVNREKLRSELRRQEFEAHHLRELEKMKSRFFANLSHEFRTPLLLIKGPLEQLIEGKVQGNLPEYYQMIKRNADRLQNLIDQLLELSQLESETIPLNKQLQNIVSVIRGCVNNFIPFARQKNIELGFNSFYKDITLSFDRDKLEKIINNLLSNAFKFTPKYGAISVDIIVESPGQEYNLKIIVSDTGVGIAEEHLPKIFERFYQIEDSENKSNGFGIGLALVKELISIQQWNIRVESKLNEGTKFTIVIPLTQDEYYQITSDANVDSIEEGEFVSESSLENENDFPDHTNEKPSILFIDDSEDVRLYVSYLLKPLYNLFDCSNAKEGIEVAINHSPDLIISDVMMPEMDGNEFCRIIKTDIRTSHIPVILLTAKATLDSKIEGLETGADDYIVKPFESEELLVRIKNLIEQRKILREKFSKEIYLKPESLVSNILDKEFIQKVTEAIERNIYNFNFDSEKLSEEIGVSRSQLSRKLKALTGDGPGEFIRSVKLRKAAQMILENKFGITQIALEIGFASPGQFSKAFKKYFGCLPSEFREKCKNLTEEKNN